VLAKYDDTLGIYSQKSATQWFQIVDIYSQEALQWFYFGIWVASWRLRFFSFHLRFCSRCAVLLAHASSAVCVYVCVCARASVCMCQCVCVSEHGAYEYACVCEVHRVARQRIFGCACVRVCVCKCVYASVYLWVSGRGAHEYACVCEVRRVARQRIFVWMCVCVQMYVCVNLCVCEWVGRAWVCVRARCAPCAVLLNDACSAVCVCVCVCVCVSMCVRVCVQGRACNRKFFVWQFPQKMLHPRNSTNQETQIPGYLVAQIHIGILVWRAAAEGL